MGRWKAQPDANGGTSAYFDANDSGPDQIAPPQMAAAPAVGTTASPATGGVTGQPNVGAGDLGQATPLDPDGPWRQTTPSPIPSGPMIAQPGEGGMWGKGDGQPTTIEDFLKQLRDRWGVGDGSGQHLMGKMGGVVDAMKPAINAMKPAMQAQPVQSIKPNTPGMALGALFGR